MGGSSLAPEVICATAGVAADRARLHRPRLGARRPGRPARAHRRRGLEQVRRRPSRPTASAAPTRRRSPTPASTRPRASSSSPTPARPLDEAARAAGYRVFNADPNVGGRYSALTAFGLVPSGLAGVDIEALLDEAESVADLLAEDDEANPGLRLGAAIAGTVAAARQARHRRRRLRHRRLRRLGRAADRRVHRQARHRHPARRRRRRRRPRAALARRRRHRGPPRRRLRRDPRAAGRRGRGAALRGPRQRRPRRAAAAVGGTRPPSPAGCSASTRSTSPTSRAPRRPPAGCSTAAGGAAPSRPSPTAPSRCAPSAATGSGRRPPSRRRVDALLAQLDPHHGYVAVMAYLDRLADAQLADVPRGAGPPHRAADDLRLGSALPALDRPVPQGRPGRSASSCRSPRPPHEDLPIPGRAVHLRRTSSRPRPPATPRCSPTTAARCCACT